MPTDFTSRIRRPGGKPKTDFSARIRRPTPEATEAVAAGQDPDTFTADDVSISPLESAATAFKRNFIPGGPELWQKAFPSSERQAEGNYESLDQLREKGDQESERAYAANPLSYSAGVVGAFGVPDPSDLPKAVAKLPFRAMDSATDGLGRLAEGAQRRALGFKPGDVTKETLAGANRTARTVLDEVRPGAFEGPEKLQRRVAELRGDKGASLAGTRADLDAKGVKVPLQELTDSLNKIDIGQPGTSGHTKLRAALDTIIQDAGAYAQDGGIPASQLARYKGELQRVFDKYGPGKAVDLEGVGGLNRDAAQVTRGAEDKLLAKNAPGSIGEKASYRDLKSAEKRLGKRVEDEAGANSFNMQDVMTGGGFTTAGMVAVGLPGVVAAPLGALLSRAGRRQGPQVVATSADRTARLLSKIGESRFAGFLRAAAESVGPNGVTAAHSILLEREPEYRALVESE